MRTTHKFSICRRKGFINKIELRVVKSNLIASGKVSFEIEDAPTSNKQWKSIERFSRFVT